MNTKLSPARATYLKLDFQAVESTGTCAGCFFRGSDNPCNIDTPCESHRREDGKEVIWVKLEKEQPISKHDAIKEIRAKTLTLQDEIYKLIEAFETDTGMVVRGMDLAHSQLIGESTTTYHVELDVRLN